MVKSSNIDIKKLQRFYKLRNLTRYSQMTRSNNESVAEHSYYVVLFSSMICNELDLDDTTTLEVLKYAMSHDLPEIYTSDVPHPVKARSPELAELLKSMELLVMNEHMPEFAEIYKNGVNRTSEVVSTIVDLADILSVIQYANSQVKLGNSYFEDVIDTTVGRYDKYKLQLCKLFNLTDFTLFEKEIN